MHTLAMAILIAAAVSFVPTLGTPLPNLPVEEGQVTSHDGLKLAYRKVGNGSHAVMVPLGFLLQSDFGRLAAPARTIVFYDQRNRGRSDAVAPEKLSIHDEVRDMETLRAHFGFSRLTPIGYSYLGLMVVLYAIEHPDRIDRVVQLGPVPMHFDTVYPSNLRADDREQAIGKERLATIEALIRDGFHEREPREFCRQQWAAVRYALVADPARVDQLGDGFCDLPNEWPVSFIRMWPHRQAEMKGLRFTPQRLARAKQPVLTIHGTRDRNAPYGAGLEWASLLPDARLLTVEGAAHQSWVDAPERVFGAIDRFLSGEGPPDAAVVRPEPDRRCR
jgi:pimeloyl-ACP methyl ester carboxylesterase